ncbi:gamma-glutamyl-gamma-aminobutyrate hydrolase family protein [Wenzhouxiangella sp. XN79A]|uniref:gamma-glutamyl-gamma-aminobutyrate hydrolase family protein n=1 Tax=Wenzhouxiangella sp. XN79A TaxID=2724193 RepID=UPI00144AF6AE|nr:gamma-glutamyl-gamma-aminobutyrate hydrolase family protein [Wenzhouxiangella sp. XN79A]NKI33571.1 gamma-glutamyl-gamma-aminobutyrate hydrolase family protein [Wenzhouxiangella sp. XN79A]
MSRSASRPIIGVTGPDRGGLAAWWFTALAIRRAGGRPLRIRPKRPHTIDAVDGLVIGGGADVSPSLYGERRELRLSELADRGVLGWRRWLGYVLYPLLWLARRLLTKKRGGLDSARDALETRLIRDAIERDLPMLGICRGMQLINVACGGTLHQSLEGFYDEVPAIRSVLPRKRVRVTPDSHLHRILGCRDCRVNALHSQAIDRLADGLAGVAREPSGVLQAWEHPRPTFRIGVQWHPEYLPQRAEQQALFVALVAAARELT